MQSQYFTRAEFLSVGGRPVMKIWLILAKADVTRATFIEITINLYLQNFTQNAVFL